MHFPQGVEVQVITVVQLLEIGWKTMTPATFCRCAAVFGGCESTWSEGESDRVGAARTCCHRESESCQENYSYRVARFLEVSRNAPEPSRFRFLEVSRDRFFPLRYHCAPVWWLPRGSSGGVTHRTSRSATSSLSSRREISLVTVCSSSNLPHVGQEDKLSDRRNVTVHILQCDTSLSTPIVGRVFEQSTLI